MHRFLMLATILGVASTAPVLASSDSGLSYRCQKSGGRYVMINGSRCFPHQSVETQMRHQPGVIVRH